MGASHGAPATNKIPAPEQTLKQGLGQYDDSGNYVAPDSSYQISNQGDIDAATKKANGSVMGGKMGSAVNKAGAGIAAGLASLDQAPPQVAAGPQLGAGVAQAPQMGDSYAEYIKKLQQQQQTPFYGN